MQKSDRHHSLPAALGTWSPIRRHDPSASLTPQPHFLNIAGEEARAQGGVPDSKPHLEPEPEGASPSSHPHPLRCS